MVIKTEIKPGASIGEYQLGMSAGELETLLPDKCEREDLPLHTKAKAGAVTIWVEKASEAVSQIMVGPGFEGRFLNSIGIGSTLADVRAAAGDFEEQDEVYVVPQVPGICFELEDVDDWDELTAPIEFISVYEPEKEVTR